MTMPDHRTMRARAAAHDRQLAGAYALGVTHGRQERRRLVVLSVVAALVLLGRRHLHPFIALLWAVLVVCAFWPLVLLGAVVETMHRQHRRWRSWPRTGALVATWGAVAVLAYLAVRMGMAWPLVGAPAALVAWAAEHGARVHGWRCRDERSEASTDRLSLPSRRATASPQETTAPALPRAVVEPYRVIFTSKAEHLETRRYGDGRTVTVDTRTGAPCGDPWPTF